MAKYLTKADLDKFKALGISSFVLAPAATAVGVLPLPASAAISAAGIGGMGLLFHKKEIKSALKRLKNVV